MGIMNTHLQGCFGKIRNGGARPDAEGIRASAEGASLEGGSGEVLPPENF